MRKIRNLLILFTIVILAFGSGFNLGKKDQRVVSVKSAAISDKDRTNQKGLDFSLFWDVWDRLYSNYLDKSALEPQKMIYGAISGMVASLDDPYTVFLTPSQNKEAKDDLGGKFEGIGAQLGVKDKKIVVIAPLKKSPAETAGLSAGDWIVKVDGKDTFNWTLPEAVAKIRGPKGSKVMLTIIRKDEEKSREVEVLRDEIKVASVEWEKITVDCQSVKNSDQPQCVRKDSDCPNCLTVYYLKLARFGDNTNAEWTKIVNEVVDSKSKLPESKILGLVFDVRNNPGGYLAGSVYIASEFIKDGTVVMQENADGTKKTYKVNRQGKLTDIPMVALMNKGSASASEIVAGTLKVRKNIPLVGETSFGKGTIQEAQDLPEGAGIHITTAKWLLPDNSNLNGDGIKPDVEVTNEESNPDRDFQLEKAVDILYEKK
ncbi:hypothetical protein A2W14_04335 [Candidatus Gottesmanbacteria bacterium RBG_16_37_8]|uniref:PDZ domain-containing protein n=1 Tax=Candidatus Gottesmanbacteria bacterium RBG_16_37_8 TaxID=1798371 RepID=A0A1F5YS18_9BACT|nr:MAG: hypothetical protein A2W14_04335 [Candidatus Gottesmanbacteria bacterium RBG_16_37_8]